MIRSCLCFHKPGFILAWHFIHPRKVDGQFNLKNITSNLENLAFNLFLHKSSGGLIINLKAKINPAEELRTFMCCILHWREIVAADLYLKLRFLYGNQPLCFTCDVLQDLSVSVRSGRTWSRFFHIKHYLRDLPCSLKSLSQFPVIMLFGVDPNLSWGIFFFSIQI